MLSAKDLKEKFDIEFARGKSGLNAGLPMPFSLLSSEVCGIQQGRYDLWMGSIGSGKSTVVQEGYISYPIQYCEKYKDSIPFTYEVDYFNLEIPDVNVMAKLLANWIYKESKGAVKVSVNRIFQKGTNRLTADEVEWITKSYKYLDFLLQHCNFITGEGISEKYVYKRLIELAKKHGTMEVNAQGAELLYTYKPKDPNKFIMIVFDNVNNLNSKELIDKCSSIFVKFRNNCKFSFSIVQQYNRNQEANDREFMEPQIGDGKDSGLPGQDCDTAFLTYIPARFGLTEYKQYMLNQGYNGSKKKLGDFFRMVKLAKNRDGQDNIYLPYAFNGAAGIVKELVSPLDWKENKNRCKDYYFQHFGN
jgi:hypothetical protein